MDTCQIDNCELPVFVRSRGWCRKHYHRWHRTGDPLVVKYERAAGTPLERWWAKVEKTNTCWLWRGSLDRRGYGQFDVIDSDGHRNHRAHRWGYQQLVRPLNDDEPLDHLCRVHACVNPAHLEPVTHAENVARGEAGLRNASKTHCDNGHEFTPENTYRRRDNNARQCRECARQSTREAQRKARGTPADAVHNGDKTHCKHGHEFTPENTYNPPKGGRQCRTCARVKIREYMQRKRAAAKAGAPM
jgi:hypothetical protein